MGIIGISSMDNSLYTNSVLHCIRYSTDETLMSIYEWVLSVAIIVALVVYLKLVVKLNFECPECGLSYTNWMHEETVVLSYPNVELKKG